MIQTFYQTLEQAGYHQNLHSALNFIPMGLGAGAFVFFLFFLVTKKPEFFTTASHCIGLGLLGAVLSALSGFMDWQYRLKGAMNSFISAKLVLSAALLIVMAVALKMSFSHKNNLFKLFVVYFICFALVLGLGYTGGELL